MARGKGRQQAETLTHLSNCITTDCPTGFLRRILLCVPEANREERCVGRGYGDEYSARDTVDPPCSGSATCSTALAGPRYSNESLTSAGRPLRTRHTVLLQQRFGGTAASIGGVTRRQTTSGGLLPNLVRAVLALDGVIGKPYQYNRANDNKEHVAPVVL